MIVTRHADKRIRQRVGIPRRAIVPHVQKVFGCGTHRLSTKGNLYRYLDKKYHVNRSANNVVLHGLFIYFFRDDTLITVLDVPPSLRSHALSLIKRGGGAIDE